MRPPLHLSSRSLPLLLRQDAARRRDQADKALLPLAHAAWLPARAPPPRRASWRATIEEPARAAVGSAYTVRLPARALPLRKVCSGASSEIHQSHPSIHLPRELHRPRHAVTRRRGWRSCTRVTILAHPTSSGACFLWQLNTAYNVNHRCLEHLFPSRHRKNLTL